MKTQTTTNKKTEKRIFIFCFLLSAFCLLPLTSSAQGGTTGPLTWELNNGTLTISGEGMMPDYDYPNYAPWYDYQLSLKNVVMEDGITKIGSYAFKTPACTGHSTLFSIPNSVTSIGDRAFYGCCNLHTISIPESVKSIGAMAFAWCQNLRSIIIPNNVTVLGASAFYRCDRLYSVTILGNISSIEDQLFSECWNLTSITIPSSVTRIGKSAFDVCSSLPSITIPNSVISIGDHAFSKCRSLTSIIIPDGVTSIGNYAFANCRAVTSVFISESVKSIGHYAFAWCFSLNTVCNLNTVPVDIQREVFDGVTLSQCNLKVPVSAVPAYQNAAVWKNFMIFGGDYYVQASVNNIEYGYATGSDLYESNDIATVAAIANLGYKFINWTKDGVEVSTENPYRFTVTEDIELVANFEIEVGITETGRATSLRVYPNPTTGELRIENGELRIDNVEIFDVFGKIHSSPVTRHSSLITINISHLPAGIYFVKIKTENGYQTQKIIKN